MKKEIQIGNLKIGGNNPILIQSMTNIKTSNIPLVVKQIKELEKYDCNIIRVSVMDKIDAESIKEIKKQINIPIIADIHFDYNLAIESIKNGADKIRINPGNIGSIDNVKKIIETAKVYNIPIRIGVNSGSIEKEFIEKYPDNKDLQMIESLRKWVKVAEDNSFTNLVLSVKPTDIDSFIRINRILDKEFSYPLHIGLTESGTPYTGLVRSSYAIGTLLKENIGSTIRVSLNGDPVNEIKACKEILSMCNKLDKPLLICCPTCGRTSYNMTEIVNEIETFLDTISSNIKVAIMGCAVNGPGEASDADIGIAGGNKEALLFKKGKIIRKIKEENIVEELKKEIISLINENR